MEYSIKNPEMVADNARVYAYLVETRKIRRFERDQKIDPPPGKDDADRAADYCDQNTLS